MSVTPPSMTYRLSNIGHLPRHQVKEDPIWQLQRLGRVLSVTEDSNQTGLVDSCMNADSSSSDVCATLVTLWKRSRGST